MPGEVIPFDVKRFAEYIYAMIRSFKDRETAKIYRRNFSRKLPGDIQAIALRKLKMLNNSASLDDLRVPPQTGWKN